MRRTLSVLLVTAATALAHAEGSGGSGAPVASKKIPEEQPVPTTPLIIAGVALAAFAVLLLVGRSRRNQRSAAQQASPPSDLAEVRLVIETDEPATVTTSSGVRASTDRTGEAVLHLPVGTYELTIEVGSETFLRSIQVTAPRKMRLPINLTKERIARASSGQVPVVARTPSVTRTSPARAYPDASTQGELGNKLAGLIDVELDRPKAEPARKAPTTKAPLNLNFSDLPELLPPPAPAEIELSPVIAPSAPAPLAAPAPGPLELDDDLDIQLPSAPDASRADAIELPPSPVRASALAGAPASPPEQRASPLRDVVAPRVTKADRQQAASAIADFAVDELPRSRPVEPVSIGQVPDLDLAPPVAQSRAPAPRTYVDIGDFAVGELGAPTPVAPVELPAVTAVSVADLELDLPVRVEPKPPARPAPDIEAFELTPPPSAAPRPPTRATRASVSPTGAIGNRYRKAGGAGAGMLGALYRGRDEAAERDVWIEELPRDVTLAVPAATLAKLEHPNILRFFELVSDPTKHYLVSELVEGKSLEQLMAERGGALSALEAIAIVDQVCVALAFAHHHDVFHRNVRPACVWISGRSAKLSGFGISLGRPTPYQAPELTSNTPPDVRSDLYSVGITLVQLLTGTPPGGAHIELPTDLPRSLAGLIRKLISREPMIRPNNVKVVRDAFASMF